MRAILRLHPLHRNDDHGRARTVVAHGLLLPVVAVILIAMVACGVGSAGEKSATRDLGAVSQSSEQGFWIVDQGEQRPFENGDAVSLGDVDVEISMSPFPPDRSPTIDFYVTRSGIPVEGATVALEYDMTVMAHGPFRLLAAGTGQGHYLAPVDFAMDGDFWLNANITAGDEASVLSMLIRATR